MPESRPSLKERANLHDRQPSRPLRPEVVEEEVLVPLSAIDLSDEAFATRVDLRLDALMRALTADGQINAVHLRPRPDGRYQILAGHRRCNAASRLDWATLRAVLHPDLADEEAWRLAWQDNAARHPLSQEDRWWTVAKLLQGGRNQRTVAGILGVHESTVSKDAAWLRLPEVVRRQVGDDGFTLHHALALVPLLKDAPARPVGPLLQEFRKEPCSVQEFQAQARRYFAKGRAKQRTGVKLDDNRLTVNEGALNLDALGDEGVAELEARLRRVQLRIEAWRADRP